MINIIQKIKKSFLDHYILAISIFFVIIYSLISLVPHYRFLTHSFDMGVFNQAIYQYSHLEITTNTVLEKYILGDHVELIMIFFAPLYWLFGSYTLLIIQICAVILGGFGIYSYLKLKTKKEFISVCGMVMFFLSYGVLSALAYDYHNNTIGIMFLPWMLYFFEKKQLKYYYLFLFLFLISKEDLALVSFFLGISFIIFEKRKFKWHGFATLLISAGYFLFATQTIIPIFLDSSYVHLQNYQHLGNNFSQIMQNILLYPFASLKMFFDQSAKIISWQFFLISGGIIAIFYAPISILLVPMFAEKFFSATSNHWGIPYQYSVQFAPIIAIGVCLVASKLKFISSKILLATFVLFNFITAWLAPFNDRSGIIRIFYKEYYSCVACDETREAIKIIPADASVTAQENILPHLANRNYIYIFPEKLNESDYAIVSEKNIFYGSSQTIFKQAFAELKKSEKYQIIFDKNGVMIFKKNDKKTL
jgi:uncharacterized membrane protein